MTSSLGSRAEVEYDDQAAVVAIGQLERLRLLTTDPGVKHPDSNGWAWTEPHPDPQPRAISTTRTLMQAVKNGREFGFATGQPARGGNLGYAVVIDVDPRNGGEDSMHDLVGEYGMPHGFPQHTTPSGGWHYLARSSVFLPSFVLAPGVEVKGARGFVKSPPSPGYVPVGNLELDYLAPLPDVRDWLPDLPQLAPSAAEDATGSAIAVPTDTDGVLLAVYTTHAGAQAGERFYGPDVSSARFRAFTWARDGRVSYEDVVQAIVMGWRDNPAGPPTSRERAGKPGTERELRARLRAEFLRAKSTAELLLLPGSSAAQEASPNRTDLGALSTCWEGLRKDAQHSAGLVLAAVRKRIPSPNFPPAELAVRFLVEATDLDSRTIRRRLAWLSDPAHPFIVRGPNLPNPPPKRPSHTYRWTQEGFAFAVERASERRSA